MFLLAFCPTGIVGRSCIQILSYETSKLNLECFTSTEDEGFEPPLACTSMIFKTIAFVHSANPPDSEKRTKRFPDRARSIARVKTVCQQIL